MTLSANYKRIAEQQKNIGSIPCLIKAIRETKGVTKADINKVFETINKDEYARSEKDTILEYMYHIVEN